MKKILIVEDEILARIGLHQLLNWEELGFELLSDACDGLEAVAAIENEEPDILLLDLNVPKMNGLQILEYLREKKLDIKVIVISCNEEFEMVKDAMKLGAYDYLRKLNLSSEELLEILEKCRLELDQKAPVVSRIPAGKEIRYEEILSRGGKEMFKEENAYRMLLCILPQRGAENLYSYIAVCREWMRGGGLTYLQILKGNQCGYFLLESELSENACEQLYHNMEKGEKNSIYFGTYRGVIRNVSELNAGLALAEQISLISYYDEDNKILNFAEKIPAREFGIKGMTEILERLKNLVAGFKSEESRTILHEIFSRIRGEKYISLNVLRRIFMDMLGVYSMTAQNFNRTIEEIELEGDNCHYQNLMMRNSLNGLEEWFLKFSDTFFLQFFVDFKCSRSDILKNVFDYINGHMKTQIHLADAAQAVGVSGAYLSTVFKKEMGQNFIEYVNSKKIEEAKKMLGEGRLVYEVSDILGFENCTYFSKVFKRYTGQSPDAYRKKTE